LTAKTFLGLPVVKAVAAAMAAFVVIAACCATVAGASPESFPPPGRIVYGAATPSLGADSRSLFTAAPDGTGARQITTNPSGWDVDARWSPDGTQVVFTRIGPGGFSSSVWVVNADGTNAHPVSGEPSFAQHPKWSPDGRWIAFQQQTGVGPRGFPDETGYALWLVRPDGSGLRSLDAGANSCDSGFFGYGNGNAWDWSPDSRRIAFTHQNAARTCDQRPPTIDVLDLITGGKRRLTTGSYPAWSPDGTRLALVDRCRIWLISATGDRRHPIMSRPRDDCLADLDWSPDGRWIAATTSSQSFPLVATSDGKRQHHARLIPAAAVRWPPDCKWLFLYRMPPDNAAAGWGWIVHGPKGVPRLAPVPARAIVGSQADWRC
jgi:TolB protein